MPATKFSKVIEHIHKMASGQRLPEPTDRQLLEEFTLHHDQEAFATLVARHGGMVLRVCRRVLQHQQDAEDAVQAVFIVLASQAGTIRKTESLAAWLHGVAYRTAMKAKRTAARRRNHEAGASVKAANATTSPCWDDVKTVLDEAIGALPTVYRSVFVVCVLEGKTGLQAARDLGIPSGTVSSRLTWARKFLQRRLAARGIELTALLAALSIAECGQSATPACLTSSLAVSSWIAAVSGHSTALVSPQAAALAAGVKRTMIFTKTKIVLGALVAAAAVTVGGASSISRLEDQKAEPPQAAILAPPPQRPVQQAAPADKTQSPMQAYAGRVLDPDGKPVEGAKIYLLYYTPKPLQVPVRATSDRDGRFRFEVAKESLDKSASPMPWNEAILVARAEGFGLGMPDFSPGKVMALLATRSLGLGNETLQLTRDDVPITGRLIDLEGRPCVGVAVRLEGLQSPKQGTLDAFLKALQQTRTLFPPLREHLVGFDGWIGRDLGSIFPAPITDKDGRFVLHGIGRERLVELSFDGPTVTRTSIYAMSHQGASVEFGAAWDPGMSEQPRFVYGTNLQLALHPSQPIEGVIVDKDSKRPLPGAIVKGSHPERTKFGFGPSLVNVAAVADKEGRYRLTGLPKRPGNVVTAGPPEGEPYLLSEKQAGAAPGFEPISLDFQLKRGVWISGRVFDKATGQPVHAQIEYGVFQDNANRSEAPGLAVDHSLTTNAATGVFRLVALPGHGLVGARPFGNRYARADGKNIKGRQQDGFFSTLPGLMTANSFSGLIEIDPSKDQVSFTADIPLGELGRLKGTVLDPTNKPLTGVTVSGLTEMSSWEREPLSSAEFTLLNVDPGKPRMVQFAQREKNLAGFLVLKGDEKGPLTARLAAAGILRGRLVNKDGVPVTVGEVVGMQDPLAQPGDPPFDATRGTLPRGIRPDMEGKFEIKGLSVGLSYKLGLVNGAYLHRLDGKAAEPISIRAGETIELGDVVVVNVGE